MIIEGLLRIVESIVIGILSLFPDADPASIPDSLVLPLYSFSEIIPTEDIITAFSLVVTVAGTMMTVFVVNWILKRVRGG